MNAGRFCRRFSVAAAERAGALALLALAGCAGPAVAPPRDALDEIRQGIARDDRSYAHVASLVGEVGPRFAGSDADPRAVAWAVARMTALGLQNVRAEPVKVPHWVRGELELAIAGTPPQPLEAVALGGSAATPADGLEAPVVAVKSLEELEWLPDAKVKGRIVFFDHRMERTRDPAGYRDAVGLRKSGPTRAARKGAIAALIRPIGTDDAPVGHTGRTQYEDTAPKIPAAALTQPAADALAQALGKGPVRLRLRLAAQALDEADSANVIGEVPGETGEIVLLAAHLDSWDTAPGANDDGAGVAIVLEAARQVVKAGRKPRRTIRVVLFANEEFGLSGAKAYAAEHAAELDRHVLAMEADFGSAPVIRLDGRVPQPAWPRVEALAQAAGIEPGRNTEDGGADIGVLRAKGVPVLEPIQDATLYFDTHHTPRDTLDRIDRAGLTQNVGVYATLAWLAAQGDAGFGRLEPIQRGPRALTWDALSTKPLPPPAPRLRYGSDPLQFGELRVPEGHGPFPVAILVHGGCWQRDVDAAHMARLSQALTASGVATWTLEYRRVGDAGGGWPGTFLDVAAGADHLGRLAKRYPLDLHRVIAIGHSAGGQLALWLASRPSMPAGSALYRAHPLTLRGVLALAPVTDLAAYSTRPGCGAGVVPLMGGTPQEQPARYALVSPVQLPPPTVPVRILHGVYDAIVPMAQSQDYVQRVEGARLQALDELGHFELVTPASDAWPQVVNATREMVGS